MTTDLPDWLWAVSLGILLLDVLIIVLAPFQLTSRHWLRLALVLAMVWRVWGYHIPTRTLTPHVLI